MRRLAAALVLMLAASAARAGVDPSDIGADDDKTTAADVEKMAAGLRDDRTRAASVEAIVGLGPEATGAVKERLGVLRHAGDEGAWAVLQNVAQAHPGEWAADGFDVVAALEEPQKRSGTPELYLVLETACLMRALAHIGTTPAVRLLVVASDDHQGVLRNEAGRLVRKLGEKAVAALWLAKMTSSSPAVRKWAAHELEAAGRRTAADAVQTRSNEVLSDVLRAFGATHDMDALSVVLSFVDSDRVAVRAAARQALAAYDKDALWKLREAYSNLTAHPAPDDWDAKRLGTELFGAYDRARLEDVYALLDAGLAKQKDGKVAEAVLDFDKVLARAPMLDRRGEMAAGYALYAKSVEDSDRTAAIAAYRKAARLDPDGPGKGRIEGAIAALEGEELLSRGVVDETPFERALAADPANERARAELDRLAEGASARKERLRRWWVLGALVAASVALVVLFGGRRRPSATA